MAALLTGTTAHPSTVRRANNAEARHRAEQSAERAARADMAEAAVLDVLDRQPAELKAGLGVVPNSGEKAWNLNGVELTLQPEPSLQLVQQTRMALASVGLILGTPTSASVHETFSLAVASGQRAFDGDPAAARAFAGLIFETVLSQRLGENIAAEKPPEGLLGLLPPLLKQQPEQWLQLLEGVIDRLENEAESRLAPPLWAERTDMRRKALASGLSEIKALQQQ